MWVIKKNGVWQVVLPVKLELQGVQTRPTEMSLTVTPLLLCPSKLPLPAHSLRQQSSFFCFNYVD